MNADRSRLESLPNEILTDVFKYLDARESFRAFYNLNHRFDRLLVCFQYLQYSLHINATNVYQSNDPIFSHYVHTLIVDPLVNYNLKLFPNIRTLKLNNPLPEVLGQLTPDLMPYLEHLSLSYPYHMYEITLLYKRIFSNRFPHLKFCELFEQQTLMTNPDHTQAPMIRTLKTKSIDLLVYRSILMACSNLESFDFWLHPFNSLPSKFIAHEHLNRMTIELRLADWYHDDNALKTFLSYVPNLKQLRLHRRNYAQNILDYWQMYDWLAGTVHLCLPILRTFRMDLHLSNDMRLSRILNDTVLSRIQKDFLRTHSDQYRAQLRILED